MRSAYFLIRCGFALICSFWYSIPNVYRNLKWKENDLKPIVGCIGQLYQLKFEKYDKR